MLRSAGSANSFKPCSVILNVVLTISAGKDTKLPRGDLRKPLIKSDTYA